MTRLSNAAKTVSAPNPQPRTEWLGPLEHRVLSRILELGLQVFRPSDLGLDVDRRRLWDALQRLVSRGILQRVARGVYRVATNLAKVLSLRVRRIGGATKDRPREGEGTREPRGACSVSGPFFDNVRGYTFSGLYRHGDRGRVLGPRELVFFERVSYAEVLYRVSGLVMPGQLVVYTNSSQDGESVRVEYRPVKGFVKRNGLGSLIRMYWEALLIGFRSLLVLLVREAPLDVLVRALRFAREVGVCRLTRM